MLNKTLIKFLESIFCVIFVTKVLLQWQVILYAGFFLMLHLQSTEMDHLFCRGMQEQPQSLTY